MTTEHDRLDASEARWADWKRWDRGRPPIVDIPATSVYTIAPIMKRAMPF